MSSSKKPPESSEQGRQGDEPIHEQQVDPGFIYKVYAFNPDDINESLLVGYLFRDEAFFQECWAMSPLWEGSAQAWARKPGGDRGDSTSWHSTMLKLVPFKTSSVNKTGYPTASDKADRVDQFFSYFQFVGGTNYTHNINAVRSHRSALALP